MDDEPPSSAAKPPVLPGHSGQARPPVTVEAPPKKRKGFLGTIALLVATVFQFGSKLLLLMPFLKFLPVFLKTGGTMILSVGA